MQHSVQFNFIELKCPSLASGSHSSEDSANLEFGKKNPQREGDLLSGEGK